MFYSKKEIFKFSLKKSYFLRENINISSSEYTRKILYKNQIFALAIERIISVIKKNTATNNEN